MGFDKQKAEALVAGGKAQMCGACNAIAGSLAEALAELEKASLSAEERELLAHVRRVYPNATGMHFDEANAAMAVLDKIIAERDPAAALEDAVVERVVKWLDNLADDRITGDLLEALENGAWREEPK